MESRSGRAAGKQARLGALLDAPRDDVLADMDLLREHWGKIDSTNPLERANREIERRPHIIGIFPSDEAIVRLVGAPMPETNEDWTVARGCMTPESPARVADTASVRLSVVATLSALDLSEGRGDYSISRALSGLVIQSGRNWLSGDRAFQGSRRFRSHLARPDGVQLAREGFSPDLRGDFRAGAIQPERRCP